MAIGISSSTHFVINLTTNETYKAMETLIIVVSPFRSEVMLIDSRKNLLGNFDTVEAAQAWCTENGYRSRVQS